MIRRYLALTLILITHQASALHRDIDADSHKCVHCHSDHLKTYNSREKPVQIGNLVHPIGLKYSEYVSYGRYVVQPDMHLPEGKLGCTTCHVNQPDPLKEAHAPLVVAKEQLCTRCHDY